MKLNFYRRHRPDCEAGRRSQSRSSEFDERRKDWGRKCACQIHTSGTLGGKFSRKATGTSDWAEAHRIADAYEKAVLDGHAKAGTRSSSHSPPASPSRTPARSSSPLARPASRIPPTASTRPSRGSSKRSPIRGATACSISSSLATWTSSTRRASWDHARKPRCSRGFAASSASPSTASGSSSRRSVRT